MTFVVQIPENCSDEIQWIVSTIIDDFLGQKVVYSKGPDGIISITADGKMITSPLYFFPDPAHWLDKQSLPAEPFKSWDTRVTRIPMHLLNPEVPVLFGEPSVTVEKDEIHLKWDLFGAAFLLLSRYEEAIVQECDPHGRIPLAQTIEGRQQLVRRPLVDEYVEVLWGCFQYLWPGLRRKQDTFEVEVSCDVDHVFRPGASTWSGLARAVGGELFRFVNLPQSVNHFKNFHFSRRGCHSYDTYFAAISMMMNINESIGNRVIFNLKPMQTDPVFDAPIDYDNPAVGGMLKEIHDRGHRIGFHPGYRSYNESQVFNSELAKLRCILGEENIKAGITGGRQHYLRWHPLETPVLWENAGLEYDSTLGFAEAAGFRCGTSRKFRMYDLSNRRPMKLYQHPLIVMEGSVISEGYMGLGRTSAAKKTMMDLKETCRFYGGCFSVLWHNSTLRTRWDVQTYTELCSALAGNPGADPADQSSR